MDTNTLSLIKDGDPTPPPTEAPSAVQLAKQKLEGSLKKKRRRGKYKRKLLKPFVKLPWQERRKNENSNRNNRFRKVVLSKTHAPFNNNQFLMEIHKPEPENNFEIPRTPSARTRDSSFSVDSEENYFYSLPDDEEEYLTKEFSSVYEDAQSERLLNMNKNDLIQEYLLLEAKYDNLVKRTERSKTKYYLDDDKTAMITDKEASITDQDSMITERETSATSIESSTTEEPSIADVMQRIREQEEKILELQSANDKLRVENERLKQKHDSGSEDSESDSSSTSMSSSSSSSSNESRCASTLEETHQCNNEITENQTAGDTDHSLLTNGENGTVDELNIAYPLVNGFHSPSDA